MIITWDVWFVHAGLPSCQVWLLQDLKNGNKPQMLVTWPSDINIACKVKAYWSSILPIFVAIGLEEVELKPCL